MIKYILFPFICVFILCSCGSRNSKAKDLPVKISKTNENKIIALDFERELVDNAVSSEFYLNDLAANISFVKLDVGQDGDHLLNELNFIAKSINNHLVVSSGISNRFTPISLYDSVGQFITQLVLRGRGPVEVLSSIPKWSINDSLNILSVFDGNKLIRHSFDSGKTEGAALEKRLFTGVLLNDGNYVVLPSTIGSGRIEEPYLNFIDQSGKITGSMNYTIKREIEYTLREGVGNYPTEKYILSGNYRNEALFQDMFSDTLHIIKSFKNIEPYIILNRKSLMPKPGDVNDQAKKAKTVYLREVGETEKYIFIYYAYKDANHTSIWEKESGKLIADIRADYNNRVINNPFFGQYLTPDGKAIWVGIINLTKDKLYCIISVVDAKTFISEVTDNDNPVVMIVDLK